MPKAVEAQVVLFDKVYSCLLGTHCIAVGEGVCIALTVAATGARGRTSTVGWHIHMK